MRLEMEAPRRSQWRRGLYELSSDYGILKDMLDDTKSKIASLEKELYSKDFKPHEVDDSLERKEPPVVAPSWNTKDEAASFLEEKTTAEKHHKIMKKFLIVSIGFFALATSVASFVWWRGANIISGVNITIDITAPNAVAGGEPFETKFFVTNNNKVPVEAATLFIEYPEGFYGVNDKSALRRISKNLGQIDPGEAISESVNVLLYGEENTQKDVSVVLEYRMAGSNATQKKLEVYAVKISSSPVNVKLSMLKEASSGQDVEILIDVESNSQNSQDDLLLAVAYPFGFSFKSADPAPTYGANVWSIGTLKAQEKRLIKILGIIEGQEGEEKITEVSIGTRSEKDERLIGVAYNTTTETLAVTKPFLSIDIAVDGTRAPEYSVSFGKGIRAEVFWQSNNPTKITDAIIEVRLRGEALNRFSLHASSGGFYRSIDDTIIWDKTGDPGLVLIEPGAKGSMSFSFLPITLGVDEVRSIKNPEITLEIKARARRASDVGVSEEISTFASRKIKIETDLRLAVRGLYFSGPFKNTGPLPPKAENETTYTVVWTVRNASNNVSKVSVKTTLPKNYVKWLGVVSPEGEDIAYNNSEAEVVWNVGRIPAGGTREVAFQISLLPSLSQINTAPQLTGDSFLVGSDDFTKTELNDRKASVRIILTSDPQFRSNHGTVVQ